MFTPALALANRRRPAPLMNLQLRAIDEITALTTNEHEFPGTAIQRPLWNRRKQIRPRPTSPLHKRLRRRQNLRRHRGPTIPILSPVDSLRRWRCSLAGELHRKSQRKISYILDEVPTQIHKELEQEQQQN